MKPMNRMLRVAPLLAIALVLSACGFHLRRNAPLPASISRIHLVVSGSQTLERKLTRALQNANVTVEDNGGPGIAELHIPVASFATQSLSQGGYVQITEYAVRMHTELDLTDGEGKVVLQHQSIDMQDEYSYDSTETVGTAAEVQQIQGSLVDDTVLAIMFRLEAAGRRAHAAPSSTTDKP
jgi:LPS-assembly lipoprotein